MGHRLFNANACAGANEESNKALGDRELSDSSCTQGKCELCELADESITVIDADLYMTLHSVNQSIGRREKMKMAKEALAENQSRVHFLKYEREYLEGDQSEIECRESDCKALQEFIEHMDKH
ncbi:hypothetical protein CFIO01_00161 [Colletotrichum fioriniae PJ7]|uniref:Uncharacterized protein n=1 Tax=Colletotrichum fioriniae PJ7 TaxID=1445577 RepID=A0A010S6T0_9PEZI|nr:hypothetical protein CFIO01_00161 [Colletotrichum fioriniae PJ7]